MGKVVSVEVRALHLIGGTTTYLKIPKAVLDMIGFKPERKKSITFILLDDGAVSSSKRKKLGVEIEEVD